MILCISDLFLRAESSIHVLVITESNSFTHSIRTPQDH